MGEMSMKKDPERHPLDDFVRKFVSPYFPDDSDEINYEDLRYIDNSNFILGRREPLLRPVVHEGQELWRPPNIEELAKYNSVLEAEILQYPQRFETLLPAKFEKGQKIISFLFPHPVLSQILPGFIKPELKYEDSLPRLLINDTMSETTAQRLYNILTLISRLLNYDWLKSHSLVYSFNYLLNLLVIQKDFERASVGCPSPWKDRLLPNRNLPKKKLSRLKSMSDFEKMELELYFNKPIGSIRDLLNIGDRFGQQFAIKIADRDAQFKAVSIFSTLPYLPIPYESMKKIYEQSGLQYDEPSVPVPFNQSQVLDKIIALLPDNSISLESFIIPLTDFMAKNYENAAIFMKIGENWLIAFEGQFTTLNDSVGLGYVHELITSQKEQSHPSEIKQIHCSELIDMHSRKIAATTEESIGKESDLEIVNNLDDNYKITDSDASKAYDKRIHQLTDDLEIAEETDNKARQAEIKEEIHSLTDAKALNQKKFSGPSEKNRKSTSKAINQAINQIKKNIPALGLHFRNSIRSGYYCSYSPERKIYWRI